MEQFGLAEAMGGLAVGLMGKIVWDWLSHRRNGNGYGKIAEDLRWQKMDVSQKEISERLLEQTFLLKQILECLKSKN